MTIENILENYVVSELLSGKKAKLEPDESLISSGILDSLTWLQLVSFIEERFEVKISDEELIPDNFQSINAMKAFLDQKNVDS